MRERIAGPGWALVMSTLLLLVLAGCGGGSDSETGGASGIAVDPYIEGAVFLEISAGGGAPLQESTASDSSGRFSFPEELTTGSILVAKEGEFGTHNGVPFTGQLKRLVDAEGTLVVSPLTTVMANGLPAQELLGLLHDAGLVELRLEDLTADPMSGIENLDTLTASDLCLLQAAVAVNALFEATGGYGSGEVDGARLTEMVQMVRSLLGQAGFETAVGLYRERVGSMEGMLPPVTAAPYIRAAVSIVQGVLASLREDPYLDPVARAETLAAHLDELLLFYYVQQHRHRQVIEDMVGAGLLPDIGEDAVPVLDDTGLIGANSAPVASAGPDRGVAPGDRVDLDGSASRDGDGDALTYSWEFTLLPAGSGASLDDGSAVNPSFVADLAGTYLLRLTVSDGSASSVDTVRITAAELPSVDGAALYQGCAGCHKLGSYDTSGSKPDLSGTGSKIRSWYSPGTAGHKGFVFTSEEIDALAAFVDSH